MPNITIPDIGCRTTSDGTGHAHGLAVGTGTSLDEALSALQIGARAQAEEVAGEYRGGEHETPGLGLGGRSAHSRPCATGE
jgi:hypothetical protein